MYGADAFSAVVNIISKDPDESEGVTATQSFGQFGLSNTAFSYGMRIGDRARLLIAAQVVSDRQPDMPRYYPDDSGGLNGQRSGMFNTIFGPMTSNAPDDYRNPLSAHSVHATLRTGGLQLTLFQSRSTAPTSPAFTPDNAVYSREAFNRNTLLVGGYRLVRRIGSVTSTSTVTVSRHELDPHSGISQRLH